MFKDTATSVIKTGVSALVSAGSRATNFKSQYGIDSQSYLEVYLNTYNNVNSKYKDIPTSAQISVRIPLSQKAIEIKFNKDGYKVSMCPP